ncbi:MAG TPA: hypothetical protein VGJ13_05395 [Pseudonocardiaceae bacterium]
MATAAFLCAGLSGCGSPAAPLASPAPVAAATDPDDAASAAQDSGTVTAVGPHTCIALNGRADKNCTPGVTNPNVTQATIHQTICVRGWTATIRPPASYTTQLKRQQMVAYGESGSLAGYEEDHLLPLEAGGNPTDPRNLWPEPRSGAHPAGEKDEAENAAKAAVCSGQMTLPQAQAKILADWTH